MMTIVVVTALGRWMFIKDHDESTTVVLLISSATSVDGGDGGEALHMFALWSPEYVTRLRMLQVGAGRRKCNDLIDNQDSKQQACAKRLHHLLHQQKWLMRSRKRLWWTRHGPS